MPSWFDRFGESWGVNGLVDDPSIAQANAGWAFIGQAPPTVEQFNSMFQWSDNKDNWLYGQVANVIASENMVPDPNDLTQLLRAIEAKLRILLLGPTTFYIDSVNGDDSSGTGEQSSPWRTLQHAIVWIAQHVDQAFQTITLQLAPGTYEPCYFIAPIIGWMIIQGDPNNPRNYLIKANNGYCVLTQFGASVFVTGISFEAAGTDTIDYETWGTGLQGQQAGVIVFDKVAFGVCSFSHMQAGVGGQTWPWNGANSTYTIYAAGKRHIHSDWSAVATNVRNTVTIQNNPNFTVALLEAGCGGGIQAWYVNWQGTCQGVRASSWANGIISLAGQDPNTTLPGSAPASVGSGGQII